MLGSFDKMSLGTEVTEIRTLIDEASETHRRLVRNEEYETKAHELMNAEMLTILRGLQSVTERLATRVSDRESAAV